MSDGFINNKGNTLHRNQFRSLSIQKVTTIFRLGLGDLREIFIDSLKQLSVVQKQHQ